MLKAIFCMILFVVMGYNLFGNDEACKAVIKKFWNAYSFVKTETFRYTTKNFIEISRNKKMTRVAVEEYIRDFNRYKELVRKKQYAEAMALFKKLLDQSSVKVVKRDTRTFAQLSEKEKQQSIQFMEMSLKPNKYQAKKDKSMKIVQLSNNGRNASAAVTFLDPVDKTVTVKVSLVKLKGKWLIDRLEHN